MRYAHLYIAAPAAALIAACGPAVAQSTPPDVQWEDPQTGVFHLGELSVIGTRPFGQTAGQTLSQEKIKAEDLYLFNRNTLDDALSWRPA